MTGSQIRKPGDGRQPVKARVQSLDMSLVTVNWINRSMSHGRRVMSLPWDRGNTRVDSGMRLPRSHKGFILYPALPSPGHAVCGCPPFSIDTFLFCIAIVKCCNLALLSVSSRVKFQAKDRTRSSWRYGIRHRWFNFNCMIQKLFIRAQWVRCQRKEDGNVAPWYEGKRTRNRRPLQETERKDQLFTL